MKRLVPAIMSVGGLCLAMPAAAQESASEDANHSKYFVFHQANVAPDLALADISECMDYSRVVVNMRPSGGSFIPVNVPAGLSPAAAGLAGGLGGLIGGAIVEATVHAPQRRQMRRATMRQCMAFKGYSRFGVSEERWEELHDGEEREVALRLAAIASSSAPEGTEVVR